MELEEALRQCRSEETRQQQQKSLAEQRRKRPILQNETLRRQRLANALFGGEIPAATFSLSPAHSSRADSRRHTNQVSTSTVSHPNSNGFQRPQTQAISSLLFDQSGLATHPCNHNVLDAVAQSYAAQSFSTRSSQSLTYDQVRALQILANQQYGMGTY
jgi:hypothetical protein